MEFLKTVDFLFRLFACKLEDTCTGNGIELAVVALACTNSLFHLFISHSIEV